jgi:capsid portal protein
MLGLDDRSNVKIEMKNLSEYRSTDLMFQGYLKSTGDTIRQAFRLPLMYLGNLDTTGSYASSYTVVKITESQVFQPERQLFDSYINKNILWKELQCPLWKYRSLGPQVASTEELRLSIDTMVKAGALSVDNCVEILNNLFNMNVSKYNEPWSSLPVILVKNQSNIGSFQLKEITNNDPKAGTQTKLPASGEVGGKPSTTGAPNVPPIEYPKVVK